MRTFDVSGLTAKIVKPTTNLKAYGLQYKPYALINASLYDMKTRNPVGTIVENGVFVRNAGNGFGLGTMDGKLYFGKPWDRAWQDYLTGYNSPVQDGKYVAPDHNDPVFFAAVNRIGVGQTKDGRTVIVTDDAVPLKTFAENAIQRGIVTLVNLDGGASRHLLFNGETYYSSERVPYNAIVWYKETPQTDNSKKIIDASEHQGQIDWEKVKPHIGGAILRAGYGVNGNADKQFARNASECNRLGIPIGAYWFSYACNAANAEQEAKHLLNAVKPYRISLPLAYDFEYDSVTNAQQKGVAITKNLASEFVRRFCGAIEAAGYFAVNYANADFLTRYFDAAIPQRYALWLAQWPSTVDLAKPPRTCALWQWTGKGRIPGIGTDVDINEAYYDFAKLVKPIGPVSPAPTPTPAPAPVDPVSDWMKKLGIEDDGKAPTKRWVLETLYKIKEETK